MQPMQQDDYSEVLLNAVLLGIRLGKPIEEIVNDVRAAPNQLEFQRTQSILAQRSPAQPEHLG